MEDINQNYYKTKASVDEYIELAKNVNSSDLIDRLKNYLKAGSHVLEIGSGPGTDFQLLKIDFSVTGSDFSEEFLKHLKTAYTNDTFLLLDAVTLNTSQTFDAIYSNKVLQHLTQAELVNSIQRQLALLPTNGLVCHSFWKGEGEEVFKGLLVNYQTEESIKELFDPHFEILELNSYAEFEEGDSLMLIARKK